MLKNVLNFAHVKNYSYLYIIKTTIMNLKEQVAFQIGQEIKKNKYTKKSVAEAAGVSRTQLDSILNATNSTGLDIIERIVNALDMQLSLKPNNN